MVLSSTLTLASNGYHAVTASFAEARPTAVLQVFPTAEPNDGNQSRRGSLVVGGDDGTLYFLRPRPLSRNSSSSFDIVSRALETSTSSTSSSRRYPRGLASPRSMSPSSAKSSFSPFQVSKPRTVTSVSAEQAEAPKNFVDFDDEQEKMRNMVKRKGVKDKTVMDSLLPGIEKPLEKYTETHTLQPSIETESITIASTPRSPASSTRSLSMSSTPAVIPTSPLPGVGEHCPWRLVCHTVPAERARLSPVANLKAVNGHPLVLCLHSCGELGVYSTLDGLCQVSAAVEGGSFTLPVGTKSLSKLPVVWRWKRMLTFVKGKSTIILACASPEATTSSIQPSEAEGDRAEETRMAVFELQIQRSGDPEALFLDKIGDWSFEGPVEGIALHRCIDGQTQLVHVNASQHLIRQTLVVEDRSSQPSSPPADVPTSTNLPLPNPFKALKGIRSSENLVDDVSDAELASIRLTDIVDMGALPLSGQLAGLRLDERQELSSGWAWSQDEVLLFDVSVLPLCALGTIRLRNVCDFLRHEGNLATVRFADRAELHKLDATDSHGSETPTSSPLLNSRVLQSCVSSSVEVSAISGAGEVVFARRKHNRLRLESMRLAVASSERASSVLWKVGRSDKNLDKITNAPRISAMLPLELNELILGYTDGVLEKSSLISLMQHKPRGSSGGVSDIPLSGGISVISTTVLGRTTQPRIIAGANDGSIAVLSLNSLKLLARWTVFIEPLRQVVTVSSGRLKDCVLCISRDGSIAMIAMDGCQFLALVPASAAPLCSIHLGEDNLLLSYADKRSRLWDVKTCEFWRSMSIEKAGEMIKQGGWMDWSLTSITHPHESIMALYDSDHLCDAGATVVFELDSIIASISSGSLRGSTANAQADAKADLVTKCDYLRALIVSNLTYGLNDDIDRICHEKFGTPKANAGVGLYRSESASLFALEELHEAWTISPDVSALRGIIIVALLHALVPYEDKPDSIHTVSAFYTASVAQAVGSNFKSPSLPLLARIWLNTRAPELRLATRQLFEGCVARLSDDQVITLVDEWQTQLPCLLDERRRDSPSSALSLFISGSIAIEKYTLLPASSLTDIAKSIALYLHDEQSPHRALAIDLCSRGFPVWQQYVDAVEILQSLFALATSGRKETNPQQSIGTQARSAVLLIASGNSPLFMTTVSMDILQPKSVQHRKSVMQLVIFLIHKKPLVLYSNLPRLVEAVVKSLDPTSTANREAVLDSATEILGHLVETYPTLDFHGPTQRLAIGTSEGAVVMYDLKTATRLYVLEGHKRRTTACAFSPDGRRLVTLSLEEHTVLVWKVGSSFTSFFMPGVPPRQGRGGSEPYKTYDFNIGDEGNMTLAATLDLVKFEWPSDRSVRIHIRGAVLTFST